MPQLDLTIMSLYFALTTFITIICYCIFVVYFFKPTTYVLKLALKRFLQYLLFFIYLMETPTRLRSSQLYNKAIKIIKKWI